MLSRYAASVPDHNLVSVPAQPLKSNARQNLSDSHYLPTLAAALTHKLVFLGFEFSLYFWHPGNSHSFLKIKSDIRELTQISIAHLLTYKQLSSTFPPSTMNKPSVSVRPVPLPCHQLPFPFSYSMTSLQ